MTDVINNFFVGSSCSLVVNLISEPGDRARAGYRGQDCDPKVVSGETRRANNVVQWIRHVIRKDGISMFIPSTRRVVQRSCMLRDGLRLAIKDGITTHSLKRRHPYSEWKLFAVNNIAAGGIAGYLAHLVTYPFRADVSRSSLLSEPLSLYKGYWQSVGPSVAFCTVFFGLYDTFNGLNPYSSYKFRHVDTDRNVLVYRILVGQVSAFVAALLSQPYVVVSHRLLHRNPYDLTGMNRKYYNAHHAMARIVAEEGMSQLFRGLVFYPSLLVGLMVVVYDYFKKLPQTSIETGSDFRP
ncbi:Adenine nucleotide translocator ATP/ADP translocase [Diplonema papillatum]|nr:Adenine nucleotide translocator ATP/ADP translocase [Diplonema papillatum]